MAKFTKRAIMLSLLKLLKQKSVDKVTVKDICDECEINRNTFYYYFKDIYDVLNNIFMEEIEKNLREAGSNIYPHILNIYSAYVFYNITQVWLFAYLKNPTLI